MLSPRAYRRVTFLALIALSVIVVSGGAVRLTGSGLGCPDWPTCDNDRLVAPWEYHAMVEFVNRTLTGLVSVAVMLAVLGSLRRRPRRIDLVRLSLGLVVGVLAQIVLGGLTVLFDLAPPFVMGHFLLSMVLLWNAVVLHHRAGLPDGEAVPAAPDSVDPGLARRAWALTGAAAVVIVLGTVVTSSGPHGGDETAPRLALDLGAVTRLHGMAVVVFLALTVATVARLVRDGAPAALVRRAEVLLAVLVAQAAVGYVQYFTGVPALLVGAHIAGAAGVWVAVVGFGEAVRRPARIAAWHPPLRPSSSTSRVSTTSSTPIVPGS